MPLQRLDLNLLQVFEVLCLRRSVARAARDLRLTPSAVSHALSRMRKALGDELFISTAAGLELTPFAEQIAPEIHGGLDRIAKALKRSTAEPSQFSRQFSIAASDHICVQLLVPLVGVLAAESPRSTLHVFPLGRTDVIKSLDEGYLDCAIGWFSSVPERLRRRPMILEEEAILVKRDHPLTREQVTLASLFQYPFVVVELTGGDLESAAGFVVERQTQRRSWIERVIADQRNPQGPVARVAATVPYFSSVAPILLETDMIATLPLDIAAILAKQSPLQILPLPYEPLKVQVEAVWHSRSLADSELMWLLDRLGRLATELQRKSRVSAATPS